MKSTLLIFAVLLSTTFSLVAQNAKPAPKRTFKVGLGTAYLGNGSYFGKQQYLEYDRRLFQQMSLGLNASRTSADESRSNGFKQQTKAYQGDLNLFLTPVNNNVNRLKMGFGGSYRYTDHRYTARIPSSDSLFNKELTQEEDYNFGYSVLLEYEVFIVRHLVLGSKAAFQKYENGDKVFFFGLNAGLRF